MLALKSCVWSLVAGFGLAVFDVCVVVVFAAQVSVTGFVPVAAHCASALSGRMKRITKTPMLSATRVAAGDWQHRGINESGAGPPACVNPMRLGTRQSPLVSSNC